MFAANEKDMVGEGRNVPAGTAMTGYGGGTPDSFHFHLCSHAGIGTVNPTFYQVLHDDNDLELDNVVKMTNALTLDSKRCEKRYVLENYQAKLYYFIQHFRAGSSSSSQSSSRTGIQPLGRCISVCPG